MAERTQRPPAPPTPPDPADCCGEGCVRCVHDVHQESLARYQQALARWQLRGRKPGADPPR